MTSRTATFTSSRKRKFLEDCSWSSNRDRTLVEIPPEIASGTLLDISLKIPVVVLPSHGLIDMSPENPYVALSEIILGIHLKIYHAVLPTILHVVFHRNSS